MYLVIFLTVFFCINLLEILPFIVYPFMYLIRAQNPENLTLILFPELTVILSCIYMAHHVWRERSDFKIGSEISLLLLYGLLAFSINLYHVSDVEYIPIIFRQYILPIIFLSLYITYNVLNKSESPYTNGISFSIVSFGMVSAISLLIISSVLRVPRLIPELFPYLNYSPDFTPNEVRVLGYDSIPLSKASGVLNQASDALNHKIPGDKFDQINKPTFEELLGSGLMQSTRKIPFIGWVFRLNLYAGGVVGSSGSIAFALGLAPF